MGNCRIGWADEEVGGLDERGNQQYVDGGRRNDLGHGGLHVAALAYFGENTIERVLGPAGANVEYSHGAHDCGRQQKAVFNFESSLIDEFRSHLHLNPGNRSFVTEPGSSWWCPLRPVGAVEVRRRRHEEERLKR
jgi:hypothetical protein